MAKRREQDLSESDEGYCDRHLVFETTTPEPSPPPEKDGWPTPTKNIVELPTSNPSEPPWEPFIVTAYLTCSTSVRRPTLFQAPRKMLAILDQSVPWGLTAVWHRADHSADIILLIQVAIVDSLLCLVLFPPRCLSHYMQRLRVGVALSNTSCAESHAQSFCSRSLRVLGLMVVFSVYLWLHVRLFGCLPHSFTTVPEVALDIRASPPNGAPYRNWTDFAPRTLFECGRSADFGLE